MDKRQLANAIKHLCNNVLKIELNEYTRDRILLKFKQLDLQSIEKIYQFLEYLDDNQNHFNVSYKNPWQRFIILSHMFNKEQNKCRIEKAQNEAEMLAQKVGYISIIVRNEKTHGKYLTYRCLRVKSSSDFFFNNFEQKQLESIGSLKYVVNLQMQNSLVEKLIESFKNIILKKRSHLIEQKIPESIQNMLKNNG